MSFRKQKEISGHAGAIYCCVANKEFIYTGSADKYVTRWKIDEGIQDKFAIKFKHSIYALCLVNESTLVVGLANGALHFFDLDSRIETKFYTQHTQAIFSIKHNSSKGHIYVTDADGNLSVWAEKGEKLVIYLPLDCGKVRSIDVDRNGEHFVLACQDGTIRIFEAEYFNEIITLDAHKGGASSVLFHPLNEGELISGGRDARMKHWNWRSEKELFSVVAHTFAIYSLASIKNGKYIISASRDKHVKVWNADLSIVKRLDLKAGGHRHSVNDLVSISDTNFATCSDDKRVIIWEEV